MQRITVMGLGLVGSAWAQNLSNDKLEVRGWNRSPKDFPFYEPDIEKAVKDAEAIIIVVADPPAVDAVLKGITPHLQTGQLVIQSSTISAKWTLEFAKRVEATGARFLEAPFTGGRAAAEARKTIYYLGGPDHIVDVAKPLLQRLSATQLHVGPVGSASSLKLAMNLNIAVVAAGLTEALTLARSQGISDDMFFQALHSNSSRSGTADMKEPKLRAHDYAAQFSLKHMDKDLRLALETADILDLPVTQTLKQFYTSGMEAGFADDDFIGLIRLLEQSA